MPSSGQSISAVIRRELSTLRRELEAYQQEEDIWRLPPGISNSAGSLALHLAGNLRHFIGSVVGGSGYVRNRDREFSARNLPRAELLAEVDAAMAEVERAAPRLTPELLAADYPEPVGKAVLNAGEFLIHLASHLSYHLGQIDYHRRLVTGSPATAGAVSPMQLPSARQAS